MSTVVEKSTEKGNHRHNVMLWKQIIMKTYVIWKGNRSFGQSCLTPTPDTAPSDNCAARGMQSQGASIS